MRPQGKHSKHNEDLHLYNSTQRDRHMSCWVFFIVNYNLKSLPRTQLDLEEVQLHIKRGT